MPPQQDNLRACDACSGVFHLTCLPGPPVVHDASDWFCPACCCSRCEKGCCSVPRPSSKPADAGYGPEGAWDAGRFAVHSAAMDRWISVQLVPEPEHVLEAPELESLVRQSKALVDATTSADDLEHRLDTLCPNPHRTSAGNAAPRALLKALLPESMWTVSRDGTSWSPMGGVCRQASCG